jgi:hypothetical protein
MFDKTRLITLLAAAFLGGALFATPAFATAANGGAGWGGGGGSAMDHAGAGPGASGWTSSDGATQPTASPPAPVRKDKR